MKILKKIKTFIQTILLFIILPFYTCFIYVPCLIFFLSIHFYNSVGRSLKRWSRSCFWCIQQPYTIEGLEKIDLNKRYIIISNHSSLMDIPAIGLLTGKPISWVMKESLLRLPILNILFTLGIGISIPRADARKSQEKLLKKIKVLKERMNPNIIIYPEGTRTKNGEFNLFKRGFVKIMRAYKMDILPVTLSGFYNFYSKKSFFTNPDSKLKIIVHPVQKYQDLKELDDKEIAKKMQELISIRYYK